MIEAQVCFHWPSLLARRRSSAMGLVICVALASGGCSITRTTVRSLAVNVLGDALSDSASVYASDEDPELVREALPFNLKTLETLLQSSPQNRGLLLSACSMFTLYAAGFIDADAEVAEWRDFDYATADTLKIRARKMYVRARNYCLQLVELDHAGISDRLRQDSDLAVEVFDEEDVETLYWLVASWGLAIGIGLDQPELSADIPAVRALMNRALTLDEDYDRGALHSAFITLESVPEALGGSPVRAREHFHRAVELSGGLDASPYVSLASGVAVATQNRAEFVSLLESALAVDPDANESIRLANLVAQRRAELLLDHIDELFDPVEEEQEEVKP